MIEDPRVHLTTNVVNCDPADVVVGVGGRAAAGLADFYRKVWSLGAAGTVIPLDVLHDNEKRSFELKSIDRMDHLRFKSTF